MSWDFDQDNETVPVKLTIGHSYSARSRSLQFKATVLGVYEPPDYSTLREIEPKEKDWYVSSSKTYADATFYVKPGSVIVYYFYTGTGSPIKYLYIEPSGQTVELPVQKSYKEVADVNGVIVYQIYNNAQLPNGKTVSFPGSYYIKDYNVYFDKLDDALNYLKSIRPFVPIISPSEIGFVIQKKLTKEEFEKLYNEARNYGFNYSGSGRLILKLNERTSTEALINAKNFILNTVELTEKEKEDLNKVVNEFMEKAKQNDYYLARGYMPFQNWNSFGIKLTRKLSNEEFNNLYKYLKPFGFKYSLGTIQYTVTDDKEKNKKALDALLKLLNEEEREKLIKDVKYWIS